jgi:hypothetical protein
MGGPDSTDIEAEKLGEFQLTLLLGAVFQVEVDQALVGEADLISEVLEIGDGAEVDAYGDLTFEKLGIGIFDGFGEVVLLSHGSMPS